MRSADECVVRLSPPKVGVQGQVFVVVNDDLDGDGVSDSDGEYEHPRLIEGMINEDSADIAKYIGSSTGTSHNQEICSPYRSTTCAKS